MGRFAAAQMANDGFLKGRYHEIFCFWFFSWISFPQASDYTVRAVSNFFQNSRRYSQLKVCHGCQQHRWQVEKTFKQKNFNNFVWTPLGSRVNIYINFCLQVHFKVSTLQPDIVAIICHRCQRHRWQICSRRHWYRWQFANGVIDTGGKFATGINNASENGGKICHRRRWYRRCTLTREYLSEFSKKFETVYMEYSGAGGKLIHEKNQKQKKRHCPFKHASYPQTD